MHKVRIKYFVLVGLLILCLSSRAQFDPKAINAYDEFHGTEIYTILSDQYGNIWLATLGGLVKYDGYVFKHFHPDPLDSMTVGNLLIYTILEASDGKIWIGSQGSVFSYDPLTRTFKTYGFNELMDYPAFYQPNVIGLIEDGEGRMYFGVASGIGMNDLPGLIFWDPTDDKLHPYQLPEGQVFGNVYHLTTYPNSGVFAITNNGILIIDSNQQGKFTNYSDLPDIGFRDDEWVNGLMMDTNEFIWMTTSQSRLLKFDVSDQTWKIYEYQSIYQKPFTTRGKVDLCVNQKKIWIPGDHSILIFDPTTEQFQKLAQPVIDKSDVSKFTTLEFDHFGNLWAGTSSKGLVMFPKRSVLSSLVFSNEDPNSITEGWAGEIFEDEAGSIWVTTTNHHVSEGLNKINTETETVTKYYNDDMFPNVSDEKILGFIRPGEILVNTNEGIMLYNMQEGALTEADFSAEIGNTYISELYIDSDSNAWLGTANGLYKINEGGVNKYDMRSVEMSGSLSNEVNKVLESRKGGFWVVTNEGLFYLDDVAGSMVRHGFDPADGNSFSSIDINSLYEGEDGVLWVGTWQGGLNRYDPETGDLKVYTNEDGLPSMSIQGILGDEENGALWLSTFNGISRFSIDEEEFNNFSLEDGIQGYLYADGAYLKTTNGQFVFGGSNGVNIFDPNEISENSLPPLVAIIDFKVDDQSFSFDEEHMNVGLLTHDQRNITIDYTGIHYDNPTKNKFSYKLVDYDFEWRDVGLLRSASYYNLPPGSYEFQVKAANSHNVWSDPVTLVFEIARPWWRTYWAYTVYFLILIMGGLRVHRIQRARVLRRERERNQDKELAHAKEIEKAYHQLKETQSQLIHSEKMASLGELTAGIAHEIQNPLNFVNNFSDLNRELLDEQLEELVKGELEEAKDLAKSIKENESKITHHGKRAEQIVKSMLQHSRTSSGEKERTDLNELCDEYLNLAYHGMRAKDSSFNTSFKMEFDPKLPKVEVVPQDMGRVLLNLINNAFQAVSSSPSPPEPVKGDGEANPIPLRAPQGDNKPLVVVRTQKLENSIIISVSDNGPGIPDDIKDKIFQPFFTTKPTGQGTGLGLSMSYDIVTKGHGGELKLASQTSMEPKTGTTFIINLPI